MFKLIAISGPGNKTLYRQSRRMRSNNDFNKYPHEQWARPRKDAVKGVTIKHGQGLGVFAALKLMKNIHERLVYMYRRVGAKKGLGWIPVPAGEASLSQISGGVELSARTVCETHWCHSCECKDWIVSLLSRISARSQCRGPSPARGK